MGGPLSQIINLHLVPLLAPISILRGIRIDREKFTRPRIRPLIVLNNNAALRDDDSCDIASSQCYFMRRIIYIS